MYAFKDQLAAELDELRESGLYKRERAITTPQSAHVKATAAGAEHSSDNRRGRS